MFSHLDFTIFFADPTSKSSF